MCPLGAPGWRGALSLPDLVSSHVPEPALARVHIPVRPGATGRLVCTPVRCPAALKGAGVALLSQEGSERGPAPWSPRAPGCWELALTQAGPWTRRHVPCPAWPPGPPLSSVWARWPRLGLRTTRTTPVCEAECGQGTWVPLPFSSTPAVPRSLCWDTPAAGWPRGHAGPYPGCRRAGRQSGGRPLPWGPRGLSSHARCPAAPGAGSPGPLRLLLALLPLGGHRAAVGDVRPTPPGQGLPPRPCP